MVPERPIGVDRVVQRVWTTLRRKCERLAPQEWLSEPLGELRSLINHHMFGHRPRGVVIGGRD